MSKIPFLTAQWRNLILANYTVDPALLRDHLPLGTELDLHEDRFYLSLVGFQFQNTRVLGIKWPTLHTFCELNLRFYVKRITPDGELRRGVVFIKEIVPNRLIAFIARTIYGEPYEAWDLYESENFGDIGRYGYKWGRGDQQHSITARATGAHKPLTSNSHEEFIAEHYWGYTKRSDDRTYEYEVQHPSWTYRDLDSCDINCDFGQVYGPKWSFLNNQSPYSTFIAEGSRITVAYNTTLA